MLLLCHLFIGIIIGTFIFRRTGRRAMVLVGIVGALLPDIIDKPLGHIIFQDLDNGRLFLHTLLFMTIMISIAFIVRDHRWGPVFLGLACGVVVHQLADSIIMDPRTWLWPLLGPFPPGDYVDYFDDAFWSELSSPSEWVFGIASLSMLTVLLGVRSWPDARSRLKQYVNAALPLLFISAFILTFVGIFTMNNGEWRTIPDEYMSAIVMAAGTLSLTEMINE